MLSTDYRGNAVHCHHHLCICDTVLVQAAVIVEHCLLHPEIQVHGVDHGDYPVEVQGLGQVSLLDPAVGYLGHHRHRIGPPVQCDHRSESLHRLVVAVHLPEALRPAALQPLLHLPLPLRHCRHHHGVLRIHRYEAVHRCQCPDVVVPSHHSVYFREYLIVLRGGRDLPRCRD